MSHNWTGVYTTSHRYLAEMVNQMFSDNGIESVVLDKKDSAYPTIGYIEVMVKEEDQAAAKDLLKEFDS